MKTITVNSLKELSLKEQVMKMKKSLSAIWLLSVFALIIISGCSSGKNVINPADYTDRIHGYGANIIIRTMDDTKYTGELLGVRDSTILICPKFGASETELVRKIYSVDIIQKRDINLLILRGKKAYLTGMLAGGLIGGLLGTVIGASADIGDENNNFRIIRISREEAILGSACCLGGTGILIGGLLGLTGSTEDKIIYDSVEPEKIDYEWLKQFCRYIDPEPEYLRNLGE